MKKWTPKSESMRKIEQDRSFLKILTFGQDLCKSQLLETEPFVQFPSLGWSNGFQNRNVLKKLSGTDQFWKFWLFGPSQSSNLVKAFFFFFFFGVGSSDRVRWMGQTGSAWTNGSENSGEWCHHDIIALEGHVWAREASWRRVGDSRRMWAHEWHWRSSDLLVVSGGRCLGFLTWNFQVL